MIPPTKKAAKSSSSTTQKRKYSYKERVRRISVRTSLKELKATMEDIRTNVEELIRQGQRVGTKGISSRKQKRKTEIKFQKNKTALQLMEAQVAEQREETTRMKGETAGIIQATEDKEAELELLRTLNTQLTDEIIDISEAEENLIMEIITSV